MLECDFCFRHRSIVWVNGTKICAYCYYENQEAQDLLLESNYYHLDRNKRFLERYEEYFDEEKEEKKKKRGKRTKRVK